MDKKMNLRFQPVMPYWLYTNPPKHKPAKWLKKGEGHKTLPVAYGEWFKNQRIQLTYFHHPKTNFLNLRISCKKETSSSSPPYEFRLISVQISIRSVSLIRPASINLCRNHQVGSIANYHSFLTYITLLYRILAYSIFLRWEHIGCDRSFWDFFFSFFLFFFLDQLNNLWNYTLVINVISHNRCGDCVILLRRTYHSFNFLSEGIENEKDASGIGDLYLWHYRRRIRKGLKLENVTASTNYTNYRLVENTSWDHFC
jgi:hypothetical protein